MSPQRNWVKQLANLGYGSRRQIKALFAAGRICDADGAILSEEAGISYDSVRIDGEPLDPPPGMTIMMNKPAGVTCSRHDHGRLVFDLLPARFRARTPVLSSVGRLDKETTGLLLLTDDGTLLHRIISPRSHLPKVYEARLVEPIRADASAIFASGALTLRSEPTPLRPATLEIVTPHDVRLTVTEGRYHQVRRMFAALGNRVETLHRSRIGGLILGDLRPGEWRLVAPSELQRLFSTATE